MGVLIEASHYLGSISRPLITLLSYQGVYRAPLKGFGVDIRQV